MAYSKHTWTNDSGVAINATHLNEMETGIYNAAKKADTNASNIETLQTAVGAIGTYKVFDGSSSTDDKSVSAGVSTDLYSMSLTAGLWLIVVRARFTPTDSANHYSDVCITTTSGNSAMHDRRFGTGTISLQHSLSNIIKMSDSGTIYVSATANVAGKWVRGSAASFTVRAVKIASV